MEGGGIGDHGGASGGVIAVAEARLVARAGFDGNRVAILAQFGNDFRDERNTLLPGHNFSRDTNMHDFTSGAGRRRRESNGGAEEQMTDGDCASGPRGARRRDAVY